MVLDFEKIEGRWYAVIPEWDGEFEDLEMVDGADNLLDIITTDDKFATLEFYDDEPASMNEFSTLELIDHDDYGGTYIVHDFEPYKETVWLCNVMHFVFGEHPEMIYFKVKNDE